RAAEFVREITDYLAGTAPFITRPSGSGAPAASAGDTMRHGVPVQFRKVSTGLVPDFAYQGEGVRAADITPGSPLAAAGVKPGETVKAVDGKAVKGLRDYSAAISAFSPGDMASITIEGDAGSREVKIKFSER
ncbi:MAG TPA: PDZ domain-containing protein, partial [Elusimicrobiales bacterium]|nr:PDZ domain-containing protein [Elusimicrobiales bacterium]